MVIFLLGAVLTIILVAGLWRRRVDADFFLASRRAGWLTVSGSLLATCVGGSATFGVVATAYTRGWVAFWWLGAGGIGLLLLALIWAAPMRRSESVRTLPAWLGASYGPPARVLAGALIVVMWVGVIAAQLVGAGAVLKALAGFPLPVGIVLTAVVLASYTWYGGQSSVLRTDLLQVVFIALAVALPYVFLARHVTPEAWPFRQLPDIVGRGDLSGWQFVSLLVVVGGMYIVGPDLCSRVLLARDLKSARIGAAVAGVGLLFASVAITGLGVAVRNHGVELGRPSEALPWVVSQWVPTHLGTVVNLGLLAALVSSADTCLMTAASVLALDLRRQTAPTTPAGRRRVARLYVICIAAAAVLVAWLSPRIIGNIMMAYAFYSGGVLLPSLLLRFPGIAGRVPRPAVWGAMVAGGVTPVVLLLAGMASGQDFFLRLVSTGLWGVVVGAVILVTAGASAALLSRQGIQIKRKDTD